MAARILWRLFTRVRCCGSLVLNEVVVSYWLEVYEVVDTFSTFDIEAPNALSCQAV